MANIYMYIMYILCSTNRATTYLCDTDSGDDDDGSDDDDIGDDDGDDGGDDDDAINLDRYSDLAIIYVHVHAGVLMHYTCSLITD